MIYLKTNKDNAPKSQNVGKKNTLCAYRRQRLARTGVAPEYWTRVCTPLGAKFSFEKLDTSISISQIKDIPNSLVSRTISKISKTDSDFGACHCYYNSIMLAHKLCKLGVQVQCVEGYYFIGGAWLRHRFNIIGDLYFDATAELFGKTPLSLIKYQGIRIYDSQELIAISAAFSFLRNRPYELFFTSTLPLNRLYYCPTDNKNDFCLDDNGVVRFNDEYITA